MPNTTSTVGRQSLAHPDLGYNGGATLHGIVRDLFTFFSNQTSVYWSGSITLPNTGTVAISHNLNTALSSLKVLVVEAGIPISEAAKNAAYTVTQLSGNQIQFLNASGGSKTFDVYLSVKPGIIGADLDPALAISTTGALSSASLTTSGNATVGGTLSVAGDFTVTGTTTIINSSNLNVKDANITVNRGGTNASSAGAGLSVEGTSAAILANILYDVALTSRFKLGANGAELEVVTVSAAQVLSNKTLGSTNTITGATAASFTNGGIITLPTVTGTLATLAGTEALTNKDIDGGTATNASRFTIPKGVKANLTALTRKQGTILYASDENNLYVDNGSSIVPVGGNWSVASTASVAAGGTIAISLTSGLQLIPVAGASGAQTASPFPFGVTAPSDGTNIRLMGTDDTNQVTLVHSDAVKGLILNGNAVLGKSDNITLQYLASLDRYVETARNIFG